MYRQFLRPLLFRADAEWTHHRAMGVLSRLGRGRLGRSLLHRFAPPTEPRLQCEVAGIAWPHPIGIAAGWDKDGVAVSAARAMGAGSLEIGSVSARPSTGNPKPRLWRLPADDAILVAYGLPNVGAQAVARRLEACRWSQPQHRDTSASAPLGINLVATNDAQTRSSSVAQIIADYQTSARLLSPHADYLTLNLSCPNTDHCDAPFADRSALRDLLTAVTQVAAPRPIFLKIAPNQSHRELQHWIVNACDYETVRGFILNLGTERPSHLRTSAAWLADKPGAISGAPIRSSMLNNLRTLVSQLPPHRFQIIGSGGISTPEQAYAFIRAGASALQLYTALVYHGPALFRTITAGLLEHLHRDGFANVSSAVGTED